MNSLDGMDNDLYGDGADESKDKPSSIDKQESMSPTALIPKTLLGGKEFKPGEEVVLKIVAFHGDQAEVEYATEEPHDETEHKGMEPEEELQEMSNKY